MTRFEIEKGQYGKRMVLKGNWSKDLVNYCRDYDIKELYLNIAFGWPGYDVSFLKDLKGLKWLHILTDRVNDISPIHSLRNIRWLCLSLIVETKIDFTCFPKLERVSLDWSPKIKSIFECKSLKNILMCKYKSDERDLSAFSSLPNLEELCFKICNIERIGDISKLKNLKALELHWASKLTSLKGLEVLRELRKLHIDTCRRVTKIDPIGKLAKLEEFFLPNCGDIESLKPLAGLKNLRVFHFYESTNIINGDLTVLKSLPGLSEVSFVERRHYNLKDSDMPGYEPPDFEAMRKTLLEGGFTPVEVDYILK
ncbi:MAG: hypothetical protein ABIN18_13285 [Pseudomonadota bacterium]